MATGIYIKLDKQFIMIMELQQIMQQNNILQVKFAMSSEFFPLIDTYGKNHKVQRDVKKSHLHD